MSNPNASLGETLLVSTPKRAITTAQNRIQTYSMQISSMQKNIESKTSIIDIVH